jgi:putative ABC transport system permease protein
MWPGEDPIGRRFYWGGVTGRTRTVIGVAGDIRDVRLDAPVTPMLYLPYGQLPLEDMTVLVRTRAGAAVTSEAIRREIHAIDPALPVAEIRPLAANRAVAMSAPRFRTVMLAVFGVVALLLASVGLYGVVAFTVSQRTREIGLRSALGARPASIVAVIARRAVVQLVCGIVLGVAIAAVVLREVDGDTTMRGTNLTLLLSAIAALVFAVGMLACVAPTWRGLRIRPVEALKEG